MAQQRFSYFLSVFSRRDRFKTCPYPLWVQFCTLNPYILHGTNNTIILIALVPEKYSQLRFRLQTTRLEVLL